MRVQILLGLFYCNILLSSCNSDAISDNIEANVADTIKKDIPVDKHGNPALYYKYKKRNDSLADLETLENGYDSLQIRIHYSNAFKNSEQVIVLRKNKSKWEGQLFDLVYNFSHNYDSLLSISKKQIDIEPKSGWDNFIKELYDLNILSLRDESEIKDYESYTDGYSTIVEIASQKQYRIYCYESFNSQPESIWQAKNVELIMKLLETEFNYKRIELSK